MGWGWGWGWGAGVGEPVEEPAHAFVSARPPQAQFGLAPPSAICLHFVHLALADFCKYVKNCAVFIVVVVVVQELDFVGLTSVRVNIVESTLCVQTDDS